MLYLILILLFVFIVFWLGDLFLTIKSVDKLNPSLEINPIIRFILKGRRKFIYLFKPLELFAFIYLIWYLSNFQNSISFMVLLGFIFIYSLLVFNNSHVYYKITGKESIIFNWVFIGLAISLILFIYLNYLLYQDLGITYAALESSNNKYNELASTYEQSQNNDSEIPNVNQTFPLVSLPIRRSGLE